MNIYSSNLRPPGITGVTTLQEEGIDPDCPVALFVVYFLPGSTALRAPIRLHKRTSQPTSARRPNRISDGDTLLAALTVALKDIFQGRASQTSSTEGVGTRAAAAVRLGKLTGLASNASALLQKSQLTTFIDRGLHAGGKDKELLQYARQGVLC